MDTEESVVVYIIGGAGYETSETEFTKNGEGKRTLESFVPGLDLEDLRPMIEALSDAYGTHVDVHLVDPNYKVRYYSTPEGRAYFNRLHDLQIEYSGIVTFHDCHWHELRNKLAMSDGTHYYFGTYREYDSGYTAFNVLELKLHDNVYLYNGVRSFIDVVEAECYYNVFRNVTEDYTAFNGTRPREDVEEIRAFLATGVLYMNAFRDAGFFDGRPYVQNRIRTCVLQVESVFVKGLITEYELYPPRKIIVSEKLSVGKTLQEKFTESAEYRRLLCAYGAGVLCKLGLRYGLLKSVSDPMTIDFNQLLGEPRIPEAVY